MGEEAYCSSSGEEDGDAQWKAAINSVATDFVGHSVTNGSATKKSNRTSNTQEDGEMQQKPKLYQIKVQKLLEEILDKSLVVVNDPDPIPVLDNDPPVDEGGIRLFRHAPPGIIFDPTDEQQPRKRPRILPGEVADEKSKKFRRQLKSVAVDGIDIMAAARDACQKSLARFKAKDAAAKAAAKREEERVVELKKIRGEKWLPSIAKEMWARK